MSLRLLTAVSSLVLVACGAPPEGGAAQIVPDGPSTTDDLAVEVTEQAVPRNDRLEVTYSWTWYVDDQIVTDLTSDSVPATRTTKGETWRVVGVAFDGKREGEGFSAQTTILNTPPVATVSLVPATPRTDDALGATATSTDADGDEVTYRWSWTVDGQAADGLDGPMVPSDRTVRGQQWVVTVVPNDGEADGEPVTAATTILNTAPEVTSLSIAPAEAFTTSTLSAVIEAFDRDGDAITYAYRWFVDGAEVATSPTLAPSFFTRGRFITVEVTPSDDADTGTPVLSDPIEILNSVPTAPDLAITPAEPFAFNDLVCDVTRAATDADGDPISYTFTWTVDGARWTGSTGRTTFEGDTIARDDTEAGQVWSCSVTASDGLATGPAGESAPVTIEAANVVFLQGTYWVLPDEVTPSGDHAKLCESLGLRATAATYTVPEGGWSRALYEELTEAFGYRTQGTGCCAATMWCKPDIGTCETHSNASATFFNWGHDSFWGQGVFACVD